MVTRLALVFIESPMGGVLSLSLSRLKDEVTLRITEWPAGPFLPFANQWHEPLVSYIISFQIKRESTLTTMRWLGLVLLACCAWGAHSVAVMSVDLGSEWMKIAVVTVSSHTLTSATKNVH